MEFLKFLIKFQFLALYDVDIKALSRDFTGRKPITLTLLLVNRLWRTKWEDQNFSSDFTVREGPL